MCVFKLKYTAVKFSLLDWVFFLFIYVLVCGFMQFPSDALFLSHHLVCSKMKCRL